MFTSIVAFSANLAFDASAEIADSVNYPNMRFFTAATVGASTPQKDCKDAQSVNANKSLVGPYATSSWAVSGPAAFVPATGPTFTWPSAVCYFFGRDVYRSLGGKVPIGLLASDWGGEPIEPFMSADALADKTCGGTKPQEEAESQSESALSSGAGGTIWNGMIAPLLPMRFAGMLWVSRLLASASS